MPKKPNYTKFFSVYTGCNTDDYETIDDELLLDCPFPDCPNPDSHFFANIETGQWHCKRCDESGNARGLITSLHQIYLPETTTKQYKLLERLRHIDKDILLSAKWAYNAERDMWLVPYFTYDPLAGGYTNFLNNLGYFFPSAVDPKSQFAIHKASVLPLYLYNPGIIKDPSKCKVAVIDEGEWDTLANYELGIPSSELLLGKPGAGFNVSFMPTISHCDSIIFQLDHDASGRKQLAKAVRVVQEVRPKMKVFVLDWTLVEPFPNCKDESAPGKDIRDLKVARPSTAKSEINKARILYSEAEESDDGPVEKLTAGYVRDAAQFPMITSFDDYLRKVTTIQHLNNKDTILSMAAVFAITSSISIEGEPIWAFLIGPPSSGKTTLIESFGGTNQWFDNLSKISAESFVSGWRDEDGEESSYLPSLKGKTLFVKDFTTTLTGPKDAQQKVFGLLTDIFDGHVKIHYGNNKTNEFHDTYFNMVAGVTDIVHSHSAASIGERFLRIDWLGKDYDPREYARRALANFGESNEHKRLMTSWSLGFVKYLREKNMDISIESRYVDPLIDLAEFIAIVRTKVEEDRYEGMLYKPRSELPTRLAKVLAKLFVASKLVVGSPEKAFNVVRKVAFDTCYGFPLDIVNFIHQNPYATKVQIAAGTGIHSQRAYRVIRNLTTTGVLKAETAESTKAGRQPVHYEINPKLMPALDPEHYISSYDSPKNDNHASLSEMNGHGHKGLSESRSTDKRQGRVSSTNGVRPFKPKPSKRLGSISKRKN